MKQTTFEEIQAQIQEHYRRGEYAQALELSTNMTDRFPEQAPLFYYWRICMAARLDRPAQSLRLLNEVLDSGIWYGEVLLRKSPSLQSLQDLPEFERLIEHNRRLQSADQEQHFPLITLRQEGACVPGGPACPFLLALHGNASNITGSVDFWRAAASAGWLVAVPQSTQAMWKGAYVWDDLEITRQEVPRHFEATRRQYATDPSRTVIAGHSMGGEVAIWLALTGAVEVSGFLAIGPGGPLTDEPDSWKPLIEQGQGRGLRGYLIAGEDDDAISRDDIQILSDRLNEAGIPCDFEELPGVTHDFSPAYENALLRGLEFITEA